MKLKLVGAKKGHSLLKKKVRRRRVPFDRRLSPEQQWTVRRCNLAAVNSGGGGLVSSMRVGRLRRR